MSRKQKDGGFSLIELLIVIAVLAVLTGILLSTPRLFRRKEVDKYTKELCNQIRQMQTISMSKAGTWRLAMYEKDGRYYCVQEKKEQSGADSTWNVYSGETELGLTGAVGYLKTAGGSGSQGGESLNDSTDTGLTPIFVWRFNRDTGACMEGSGTYQVSGYEKVNVFKVYSQSGRCEEGGEP